MLTFAYNLMHNTFMQSKSAREFPKNGLVIGQTIQYVASYRQQWVALLIFSAAALKSRHRDKRLKGELNMTQTFRKLWAKPHLAIRMAIP